MYNSATHILNCKVPPLWRVRYCGTYALDRLTNCNFAKKLLGLFPEALKPTHYWVALVTSLIGNTVRCTHGWAFFTKLHRRSVSLIKKSLTRREKGARDAVKTEGLEREFAALSVVYIYIYTRQKNIYIYIYCRKSLFKVYSNIIKRTV